MALAAGLLMLGGCVGAGYIAQAIVTPAPIEVTAEYAGLANQRVAVLVDADLSIQFEHPLLQLEVATAVSQQIASNVPGATLLDARQVVDFQNRNIYWNTLPYADVARRLGATRLVLIDLVDYRLHERGDVNIHKGLINASVGVAEADGAKPNDLAYSGMVAAAYPPDKPDGIIKADSRTIQMGVLDLFARGVAGKFYDHKIEREAP
jgi:hypothetical protein